jgi:hypothetical protein
MTAPRPIAKPFEIKHQSGRKVQVAVKGEWIGEHNGASDGAKSREIIFTAAAQLFQTCLPLPWMLF